MDFVAIPFYIDLPSWNGLKDKLKVFDDFNTKQQKCME